MRVFHTTDQADSIQRDGFSDGPSALPGDGGASRRGIWLSDRVMTSADFAGLGEDVLEVELPAAIVAPFEQADDDLGLPDGMPPYRAYLVPAAIVNQYPIVRRVSASLANRPQIRP